MVTSDPKKISLRFLVGTPIIFLVLLLMAPQIQTTYYQFIPLTFIMEIDSYSAPDVPYGTTEQTITIKRELHIDFPATWVDELTLIEADGYLNQTIVGYVGTSNYKKNEGNALIYVTPLPKNLSIGSYYWNYLINARLPGGAYRQWSFSSNVFNVYSPQSVIKEE